MAAEVVAGNAVAEAVILFDGVCNLCHGAVRFVIARDPRERFRFASLQSEAGRELLRNHGLSEEVTSIVLIEDGDRVSLRSTAALRIARRLRRGWPLCWWLFAWVPGFLRDAVYNWIARSRYRWFGKKDECPLPDPALAHRFLG